MMKETIRCEIIRDLLPSYVDGLTSPVSNEAIASHLAHCPACQAILETMQTPTETLADTQPQVDYLRQIKRKNRRRLCWGILLTLVLALGLLGVKLFFLGQKADPNLVYCNTQVEENTVEIEGTLMSSAAAFARCRWQEVEPGVVQLTVYTVLASPFHQGDFTLSYTASAPITQVYLGDRLLWEQGQEISLLTNALYATQTPYVGDAPAITQLAELLSVSQQLGSYTNQLHTESEPYAWDILLEKEFSPGEIPAAEELMTQDAYLLLALIGNLEQINWIYTTSTGEQTLSISAAMATENLGQEIKSFATAPSQLEGLLRHLGRSNSSLPLPLPQTNTDQLDLTITNHTEAEIFSLTLALYINGEWITSQGTIHADESPFFFGETLNFTFSSADLAQEEITEMQISPEITLTNGETYHLAAQPLSLYSGAFAYQLTGSVEEGFSLQRP